jgi:hypothetical protein
LRREEKEMNIDVFFTYRKKKKNEGALSVVKLGILGFLLGCFTDGFING